MIYWQDDLEDWLNAQLMTYAIVDGVEAGIRRAWAVAISDPLEDLTGEDIVNINVFVVRSLALFETDPVDYDAIFHRFRRAIVAASGGRANLSQVMSSYFR